MAKRMVVPAGWDYEPDRRPARSLLAGLEPIGLGTSMAESLAGYIVRLSWGHGRAPVRLVRDVLAPALDHPTTSQRASEGQVWEAELLRVTRHGSASLLGHAPVAATWADALGAAIGRPILRGLTTLPWADVLPKKRLLRAERAWCPACLEIRRLAGHPAYEPLLWQFMEVKACVEHEVALETTCPACGARAGVLTGWSRAGHCRCGTWLGSLWFHEESFIEGEDLDWQRFVVAQVGEMIAMTPRLSEPVSGARTADAVQLIWDRSGMSLIRLAKATGLALSTLSLWKDGRRQPSLPAALRLCRVTGVTLVDFLRSDLSAIASRPLPHDAPYVAPSGEHHAPHDWAAIEVDLTRELQSDAPRSLAAVLRSHHVDVRLAKRTLPVACRLVAERHKAEMDRRGAERRTARADLVHAAIAAVRSTGEHPSRHQVQKLLPTAVSLRDPALNAIWVAEARDPELRFLKV